MTCILMTSPLCQNERLSAGHGAVLARAELCSSQDIMPLSLTSMLTLESSALN